MQSSVLPISGCRTGTYVLLDAVLPERPPCTIGVLLIDADTGRPWFRMRRDFANIAEPEDAEVLEAVEEHIRQCMAESGAEAFLQFAGRHALQHTACQPAGDGLRGRIFARARSSVPGARRGYRGRAVWHPLAAVQPARRGGRPWRGDVVGGGGLGSGSRRHASLARSLRRPRDRPVDGAAHSRWQFESLPPASGWLAPGQDSADRALRQSSIRPRATRSSGTPAARGSSSEDEWRHERSGWNR